MLCCCIAQARSNVILSSCLLWCLTLRLGLWEHPAHLNALLLFVCMKYIVITLYKYMGRMSRTPYHVWYVRYSVYIYTTRESLGRCLFPFSSHACFAMETFIRHNILVSLGRIHTVQSRWFYMSMENYWPCLCLGCTRCANLGEGCGVVVRPWRCRCAPEPRTWNKMTPLPFPQSASFFKLALPVVPLRFFFLKPPTADWRARSTHTHVICRHTHDIPERLIVCSPGFEERG